MTSGILTPARGSAPSIGMANVSSDDKKQQGIALGRLGWTLRRIQKPTCAPRNGQRLPKGRRDWAATAGEVGTAGF
jgi:hypothetical protein